MAQPPTPEGETTPTTARPVSVSQVLKLRDRLRKELRAYEHTTKEGSDFEDFVREVCKILPKRIPFDPVFVSLRHLAGEVLTPAVLRDNFWRLAGNLDRLLGKPVPPWTRQGFKEWVPVQIESAKRRRGGRGDLGWLFTFRIAAGTSCPLTIQKFWSDKFCRYLAPDLGFSTRRISDRSKVVPQARYQHPTELVTLRLHVLVDPELCGREPGFDKVRVQSADREWNREQLCFRDRLDAEHACPKDMPRSVACFRCPIGYKACRAAVHREDYTFGFCPDCNRDDVPFDPELSTERCIECMDTRAMTRQ